MFSCEFCEIFYNVFFTEHLAETASFCNLFTQSFILQKSFIYLFKTSFVRKIDKNWQFFHFSIWQIHFILYIVNLFYRSEHKHKKSYLLMNSQTIFIKQSVKLYLQSKIKFLKKNLSEKKLLRSTSTFQSFWPGLGVPQLFHCSYNFERSLV